MKKLLYLLVAGLLMTTLVACNSDAYIDESFAEDPAVITTAQADEPSYDDALKLMMKTFSNDFTKDELYRMYPPACWTYFEEVKGKTLDEIYENFSSRMEANWEIAKQTVGEGAAVKYELLSRVEYEGNMYESFKEEIIAKYGIPYDAFGICYEVKVMKATVGKLKEDLATQFYHVIQIDDQWYVAEVLTEMPIL